MQISEAARAYAGSLAAARTQPAPQGASASQGACNPRCGRDLDAEAATRVFSAEVLQRVSVVRSARIEGTAQPAPQPVVGPDAVGQVANALRSAAASNATGAPDPVPGLLRSVDAGIAGAENTLKRMGYDAGQVASAAVHFRSRVSAMLDSQTREPASGTQEAAVSASHVRKERGSIELVTQDGDVVRIRFRSREAERVEVAGVQGAEGTAMSARIVSQQSARLKVAVSGELDAGELKAIEDFLGKVDTLASEFYGGDVDAAFAAGTALQADAQEIARFSVKLALTERYAVGARVAGPAALPAAPPPSTASQPPAQSVPQPSTTAPAVQPSTVPSAPAQPQAPTPATAPASEPAGQPAEDPAAASSNKPAESAGAANILDTIRGFIQRVLGATQAPIDVHGVALQWRVKIELTAAVLEAARPQERSTPGSELLGQVMDHAARAAGDSDALSTTQTA